jgi:hypothetical protein
VNRPADQTGSVTLEAVLVLPAVIFTLLIVIQVALVGYAGHVADSAAREGARAARLSGQAHDGQTRAEAFLHRFGSTTVLDPHVDATATPSAVNVHVTGHAATLLPGFDLAVTGHSRGPVERFDTGPPS